LRSGEQKIGRSWHPPFGATHSGRSQYSFGSQSPFDRQVGPGTSCFTSGTSDVSASASLGAMFATTMSSEPHPANHNNNTNRITTARRFMASPLPQPGA
jgi:hypothetical protein